MLSNLVCLTNISLYRTGLSRKQLILDCLVWADHETCSSNKKKTSTFIDICGLYIIPLTGPTPWFTFKVRLCLINRISDNAASGFVGHVLCRSTFKGVLRKAYLALTVIMNDQGSGRNWAGAGQTTKVEISPKFDHHWTGKHAIMNIFVDCSIV